MIILQLQADLHTHTIASTHGYSTITEMATAAAQQGLKLLAITDHGPASPDAPHLWHFHNYKILPRRIAGVWLLKGVEANIVDEYGSLHCTISPASHFRGNRHWSHRDTASYVKILPWM